MGIFAIMASATADSLMLPALALSAAAGGRMTETGLSLGTPFYMSPGQALAAPGTINTLPEKTLLAFADHGTIGRPLTSDGGYAEAVIDEFHREGVDDDALASRLQREGVEAFAISWHALLTRIREKCAAAGQQA